MLSRAAIRASSTTSMVARRGFHSTRTHMSSPYHYPEGPLSNIPFNPRTKFFALRYWSFMGKSERKPLEHKREANNTNSGWVRTTFRCSRQASYCSSRNLHSTNNKFQFGKRTRTNKGRGDRHPFLMETRGERE